MRHSNSISSQFVPLNYAELIIVNTRLWLPREEESERKLYVVSLTSSHRTIIAFRIQNGFLLAFFPSALSLTDDRLG